MLKILCFAQCDVCSDFFEKLSADTTANQNACAFLAAGTVEAAEEAGWFFNEKTRQFWCTDCMLALTTNAKMPDVAEISLPFSRFCDS
ncbi:MAG: hypothetical protein K2X81_11705 [Candidatus Obscuribacterales bacterium]|nr:hypothetical protein [Candidatus Obscuribacterales bacterium]